MSCYCDMQYRHNGRDGVSVARTRPQQEVAKQQWRRRACCYITSVSQPAASAAAAAAAAAAALDRRIHTAAVGVYSLRVLCRGQGTAGLPVLHLQGCSAQAVMRGRRSVGRTAGHLPPPRHLASPEITVSDIYRPLKR